MASMNATWGELNDEWPWRRVMAALAAVTRKAFQDAYPATQLAAMYANVNRGKGQAAVKLSDLLLPTANPWVDAPEPVYTRSVMTAFNEAFARRLTGNVHLAVFGVKELRASGWTGERPTP